MFLSTSAHCHINLLTHEERAKTAEDPKLRSEEECSFVDMFLMNLSRKEKSPRLHNDSLKILNTLYRKALYQGSQSTTVFSIPTKCQALGIQGPMPQGKKPQCLKGKWSLYNAF